MCPWTMWVIFNSLDLFLDGKYWRMKGLSALSFSCADHSTFPSQVNTFAHMARSLHESVHLIPCKPGGHLAPCATLSSNQEILRPYNSWKIFLVQARCLNISKRGTFSQSMIQPIIPWNVTHRACKGWQCLKVISPDPPSNLDTLCSLNKSSFVNSLVYRLGRIARFPFFVDAMNTCHNNCIKGICDYLQASSGR